ncbi:MAG: AMP-binding protein [Candidatus Pacearchaeota archaeon]
MIKRIISKILWLPFIYRWLFEKDLRNAFERLFWSKNQMDEFKLNKFKSILNYAYKYVPYYRELYDRAGIKPEYINTLEDINKIPILTKEELKKAILEKSIFSTEKRKWKIIETHTTGSTGTPTTLFFDQFCVKARDINTLRAFFINGIFPDKKFILLWRRKKLGKRELLKTILGIFKYISVVDVMDVKNTALDENKILNLLKDIKKFNPDVIRGYVSALLILSKFIKKYNLDIKVEKIIASAEYLSESTWNDLEENFSCPIINYYGGTEAAPIASSLINTRNLVVFEDFYFVNIVDDENKEVQNGIPGRILITDYHNLYMPLIRYEIGDIAEWDSVSIGPFRTFREIKGRINDVFVLPGKRLLFSHNWHIYFRDILGLKFFKVIQEKVDYIRIYLVPFDEELFRKSFDKVKKMVEESLGSEVKVEWNIVNNLPLDRGDKFHAVKSKINLRDINI